MGFGDWLRDTIDSTANAMNVVNRYIDPFHVEADWKDGKKTINEEESYEAGRILDRAVSAPIRDSVAEAMHGMNWLYDNGISQPLSTFFLVTGNPDTPISSVISGSEWGRAWRAAEHISPGQAFFMSGPEGGLGGPFMGDEQDKVEKALDAPLQYAKPAPAGLPPGFDELDEDEQQELLKKAGMPAVGNRYVERLRGDSNYFKYSTGAADFAFRWWLDPTILAGKTASLARTEAVVKSRPQRTIEGKAGRPWVKEAGWSGDDINRLMDDSVMVKAQRFLFENKDNPALINNLSMFKKSAMGPRAGGIISTLKTPDEVNLFMRTSLGDVQARARLESENALAAQRLQQDTARLAALDLALPRVIAQGNPRAQAMVQQRIDDLHTQINANEDLVSRYGGMLAHYGELDAVNLTRFSFGRAERRTGAQGAYRTGPAIGSTARPSLAASRLYDDYYGTPLTVVRSFKEAHPNGLIAIDDIHPEAVDELRGQIARIPAIGPDIRQDLLNRYLTTKTEGERLAHLDEVQRLGVQGVAQKHGLTHDEGMTLYRQYRDEITNGQEKLRRYSAAQHPGENIHVDEFMSDGGKLAVHPNLVTKLANNHVMVDLKALDTTLARHSSAIKALRTSGAGNPDMLINGLDYFNHLWKFGTLFRLGYIPRVLGDDLAGQIARVGAAAMAMRAGYGAKNLATNLAHWKPRAFREAEEATAREGLKYVDDEIKLIAPQANLLRTKVQTRELIHKDAVRRARDRARRATNKLNALPPTATAAQIAAHQALVAKHQAQVLRAENTMQTRLAGPKAQLQTLDDQLAELGGRRAESLSAAEAAKLARLRGWHQSSQLHGEIEVAPGTVVPAAFAGERGEYYQKMISSDDSLRTLLQRNKQIVHSNLQKSYSSSGVAISYPQSEKLFVDSWHQAINHQILQDPLGHLAVKGASISDMTHWLTRTPAGRAYRKRLGVKYSTPDRIAASVWHEVDEYMPAASGVRQAALKGEADLDYLTALAETGQRPFQVHTTQLGESLAGSNHMSRGLDRVIDKWYKGAASIPADRMSRHPLFNQLYEGHARTLASQEMKQGAKISQKDADRIAETARRLALKDTRKLVFDIAHRSDAAAMLRFVSPFFAATTEAWQRWARIIADRPQVVGYASMFFNAPISAGWMQDNDGNTLLRDGTVLDPVTGKKRFVPKGERRIMARIPKFVADGPLGKAFGMDSSGNWSISQDSMNLITQGDPWFNPGVGPVVSIPTSLFVKDKPDQAELARHLGVLPFGPSTGGLGRTTYEMSAPQTIKNFLTAFDTSDERYQRVKLQIMQKAAYEHANRGKPMPSAKEIANMTRRYWTWSAVTAFVQPFATAKPDEYQLFRDQYNNLRRKDPLKADEEFLARYDESFFTFAQATTDNPGGVPATKRAVELSKKYAAEIAANPELAALLIGPEGRGPFSPEAYAYQLSTPLVPGGAEMQRTKISAEEAMEENQRRLGWAKYSQMMNTITAEMHQAGYQSFADKGAEQFKEMRGSVARLYGDPLLPDGSENPYYNAEWSEDFYTFDVRKYDRLIPGLTAVAHSDIAKQPNRSDLRSLQTYLAGRQALNGALADRAKAGLPKMLGAKGNLDLAQLWTRFVDDLVEKDTRFGELHNRYLSRDMGLDLSGLEDLMNEEAA
ncbi:hypothetical protein AS594_07085 [Streptomyces agglomeratus]|uniref:Large polyvalent protein associated domain-containing protein n=1 Tax=Streptomyces agglomeratus TaxID=285458 RepID=A0A1E5P413_9ACTN|nr:hypothetical protein [Streptomyces agglomeratus]OEJ24286.1 hypothetical protein AS594_07085 [Streptomyces agglomeratus]